MTANPSHNVDHSPSRPSAIWYFLKRGTVATTAAIYASLLSFAIVDPSLWRHFGFALVLAVPLISIISMVALGIGGVMEGVALLTESRRRRTVAIGTTIPFVLLSMWLLWHVSSRGVFIVLPLTPVIAFGVVNWRYWTALEPIEKKKKRGEV